MKHYVECNQILWSWSTLSRQRSKALRLRQKRALRILWTTMRKHRRNWRLKIKKIFAEDEKTKKAGSQRVTSLYLIDYLKTKSKFITRLTHFKSNQLKNQDKAFRSKKLIRSFQNDQYRKKIWYRLQSFSDGIHSNRQIKKKKC